MMYRPKKCTADFLLGAGCVAAVLTALFTLLLKNHSAMGFSDPNHWIQRAVSLLNGEPQFRRVIVFPFFVGHALKWMGSDWVFLCNMPFVFLLLVFSAWLTLRLIQPGDGRPGPSIAWASTACVLGAATLPWFHLARTTTLFNPYRDAGAITIYLLGVWLFLRSEKSFKPLLGFFAALVCLISVGFRETMLLGGIPLGIWTLVRLAQNRKTRKAWLWSAAMLAGALLGISPTLYQNWKYSGYVFVPAYSARNIVEEAPTEPEASENGTEAEPAEDFRTQRKHFERSLKSGGSTQLRFRLDSLVPGARPEYFRGTYRMMRKRFVEVYRGLPFVLIGVTGCMVLHRKNALALGVVAPLFFITFLFYCFYRFVHWRYIYLLHVLLAPWVAAGTVWLLRSLLRPIERRVPLWTGRICLLLATSLVLLWTGVAWKNTTDNRLHAWDIPRFRESLSPHLESPRTWLGFYHHREMLSWFMDADFNHSPLGSEIHRPTLAAKGLDAALKALHAELHDTLREKHLYLFDLQHMPQLLPQWTDSQPVVDFASLPVTLYRYGRPLEGTLHEILPWRQRETAFSVPPPINPERPAALFVNPRRLWDNPEREGAELWLGNERILERLENGPQFVLVPDTADPERPLDFRIQSDQPVPARVPHTLWVQNETLPLSLGLHPEWWFPSLVSPEIQQFTGLRRDACQFVDRGDFRLPVFADSNHDVFAEFRVEFFQEDPFFRNKPYWAGTGDGPLDIRHPLPGARRQGRILVPLGTGSGALEFRNITIRSDLPSIQQQMDMAETHGLRQVAFIKAFDVRILSLPRNQGRDILWTAGGPESGTRLLGGMWDAERHLGRFPVRWTNGQGRVRMPALAPTDEGVRLTLSYFPAPLEVKLGEPAFEVNGQSLAAFVQTQERDAETGLITTTFRIPADNLSRSQDNALHVLSDSWSPHTTLQVNDTRQLGIMLHQVQWQALPAETVE